MIRVNRGGAPDILIEKAEQWTRELLEALQAGGKISDTLWNRYKHPDIKAAVQRDSFDKCIYCESKFLAASYGDIEHIKPKTKYPNETFSWQNLAFVCTKCNIAKRDTYDETMPPVNPCVDDPSEFFHAVGDLIWARTGSNRGRLTELLVQLNRVDLVLHRGQRLDVIRNLIESIHKAPNPTLKQVISEQLHLELEDDKEYAFVSRAAAAALTAD